MMSAKGRVVTPGEEIGSVKLGIPGLNVSVSRRKLYSCVWGVVRASEDRQVDVITLREPRYPLKGDIVLCRVANVTENLAETQCVCALRTSLVQFNRVFRALLPRTQSGVVGDLRAYFRVGDVLIARVISMEIAPLTISTREDELGVVASRCHSCGSFMQREDLALVCRECGVKRKSKVSPHYDPQRFYSIYMSLYEVLP